VSQCRRSSRAQQLISPGCQGIARRKKWRFFTGRRQRLPGAKTDEHASRHGLHLESAICLLTEIVRTMIPGGLSCRAQSALAYADRRIESGERRPDVVEFVPVAKALKVIFLRYLLSGDRGIVDPSGTARPRVGVRPSGWNAESVPSFGRLGSVFDDSVRGVGEFGPVPCLRMSVGADRGRAGTGCLPEHVDGSAEHLVGAPVSCDPDRQGGA